MTVKKFLILISSLYKSVKVDYTYCSLSAVVKINLKYILITFLKELVK